MNLTSRKKSETSTPYMVPFNDTQEQVKLHNSVFNNFSYFNIFNLKKSNILHTRETDQNTEMYCLLVFKPYIIQLNFLSILNSRQ